MGLSVAFNYASVLAPSLLDVTVIGICLVDLSNRRIVIFVFTANIIFSVSMLLLYFADNAKLRQLPCVVLSFYC